MTLDNKNQYKSHEHTKKSGPSSLMTQSQSAFGSDDSFDLYRPDWKYWSKQYDNNMPKPFEDNPVFGKHVVSTLPPIDLQWKAEAVIDSFGNISHQPGGGNTNIFNEKIKWKAKSKIGSLQNINYKTNPSSPRRIPGKHYLPAGTELNIINAKYERIGAKVGSLENATHTPRGGDIIIPQWKLNWNKKSRVGSLENIHHQPGGGQLYVMNQHLEWRSKPRASSLENVHNLPLGHHYGNQTWDEKARFTSVEHTPRTGHVVQNHMKLPWEEDLHLNKVHSED
ncbi:microtubule-associated protein [Biomphalaria glabrata]|nr:microtubule-associated protein tau [Biomphalaria glabrata]